MNKNILTSIIFVLTFIVIHGFLTGWLPIPLVVECDVYAREFMPVVYVYDSDTFDDCVYEVSVIRGFGNTVIAIEYWYHWSYNGFKECDDWEPVIVYITDGAITAVAHRVHYQWRIKTNGIISIDNRPLIVFAPLWHTPLNTYPQEGFEKINYTCRNGITPEDIDPSRIYYGGITPQLWLKNTILALGISAIIAIVTYIIATIYRG